MNIDTSKPRTNAQRMLALATMIAETEWQATQDGKYPQYIGAFDGWVLCTIIRDVTTASGLVAFTAGEIAICDPIFSVAKGGYTVWSVRNAMQVIVPAEKVRLHPLPPSPGRPQRSGASGVMNTIPDLAMMLIVECLGYAPPSPTVLTMTPTASLATLLRQCGAIAGIASERAQGNHYADEWRGIESVTLLACFAIEHYLADDKPSAARMLKMASDRLDSMRSPHHQEAVA